MIEKPKTVDEARCLLREALNNSNYKGNVAALTWKLWRNKRGKDFIRDFLNDRKEKLGGAAETAAVEKELKLTPGMLAVAVEPNDNEGPETTLSIIEETMRVTAYLIDPGNTWTDENFRLAARLLREFVEGRQFVGTEDPETRRLRLEIAIRRALQKESP